MRLACKFKELGGHIGLVYEMHDIFLTVFNCSQALSVAFSIGVLVPAIAIVGRTLGTIGRIQDIDGAEFQIK
jgi:hypothetical protein